MTLLTEVDEDVRDESDVVEELLPDVVVEVHGNRLEEDDELLLDSESDVDEELLDSEEVEVKVDKLEDSDGLPLGSEDDAVGRLEDDDSEDVEVEDCMLLDEEELFVSWSEEEDVALELMVSEEVELLDDSVVEGVVVVSSSEEELPEDDRGLLEVE